MKKLLIIFILLQVGLILAQPTHSYILNIEFYKGNESLSDFNVYIENIRTGEVKLEKTNDRGILIYDINNLHYFIKDVIKLTYCIDTPICNENFDTIIVNNQGGILKKIDVEYISENKTTSTVINQDNITYITEIYEGDKKEGDINIWIEIKIIIKFIFKVIFTLFSLYIIIGFLKKKQNGE